MICLCSKNFTCLAPDKSKFQTWFEHSFTLSKVTKICTFINWFQISAMFWMFYAFSWVIPWRLNFICWHFRTLSVPKRRHIKFRCRGITQKKAYYIYNVNSFLRGHKVGFCNCHGWASIFLVQVNILNHFTSVFHVWALSTPKCSADSLHFLPLFFNFLVSP